jgi:hypothetical protein
MIVIANWKISTLDDEGNLIQYLGGEAIHDLTSEDAKHLLNTGAARLPEVEIEKSNELNLVTDVDEDILKDFKEAYEYDELKKEAVEVGLEFPKNISFKNLVKLIVQSGKVSEFFEEEE